MMSELVSVIVPVYKVENELRRCVDSILAQTYTDIEVILVDDGSPDCCPAICDSYKQDKRVSVVHKSNGGLSDARNAGIQVAHGKYFAFVDSDDFVSNDMIERLYEALKNNDADIAICNYFRYFNGEAIRSQYGVPHDATIAGREALELLFSKNSEYYVVAWNKLYKRECFNDVRYPVGLVHEDEFVIHRLLYNASRVTCLCDALQYYVYSENSITNAPFSGKRFDSIYAFSDRISFFGEKGLKKLKNKSVYALWTLGTDLVRKSAGREKELEVSLRMLKKVLKKHIPDVLTGKMRLKEKISYIIMCNKI